MLEVRNLTKVYYPKNGVPVNALMGVNLAFEETGMVFILGKSGSGKSTLLNLVGGLDTITGGDVVIKGKSSENFTQSDFDSYRNTYLGFIFQEFNILTEFTVGKNIGLALELQGKKADYQSIEAILQQVDLGGHQNRKPNELSGGQKQRVAIARALIKDPQIILADEPTGSLDSNTGKQVFETLQKLSKTKLVIIVSHDRDYAEYYGDRVIEFADGKVISDIKKYKAGSQQISDGLSVIDGNILHVKKGHKFNAKEKEEVIKFLENAEADLILSKEEKANNDFRRLARIDNEGTKESFKGTTREEQNLKVYSRDDFKLIKSRLPLRHSLKIAGSSLKVKPFRLVLTIFLCAVAFGLFGLADTMAAYNRYTATNSSMQAAGVNTFSFVRGTGTRWDGGFFGNDHVRVSPTLMSEQSAEYIENRFPNQEFDRLLRPMGIHLDYRQNLYALRGHTHVAPGPYFNMSGWSGGGFGGIIEINPNAISGSLGNQSFRGMPITGRVPTSSDEIMISYWLFSAFRQFNLAEMDNNLDIRRDINTQQDLIGRKIRVGSEYFTVVGIINTAFPHEQYAHLRDSQQGEWGIWDWMIIQEISNLVEYSYHGAMFVMNGFMEEIYVESGPVIHFYGNMGWMDVSLNHPTMWGSTNFSAIATVNYGLARENTVVAFANLNQTELNNDNEILVSLNAIRNLLHNQWWDWDRGGQAWDEMWWQNWENDFFQSAEFVAFEANWMNNNAVLDYWGNLLNWQEFNSAQRNFIETAMANTTVWQDFAIDLVNHFFNANSFNVNAFVSPAHGGNSMHQQLSIVGVVVEATSWWEWSSNINHTTFGLVRDRLFELIENTVGGGGNISAMITQAPTSNADRMALIRFSFVETDETITDSWGHTRTEVTRYHLRDSVAATLEELNGIIETLARIFLWIGLVFALFASLLLMNFIIISISYKKKQIGILRAIGAKSSDVFWIFFLEALIIALISFAIASIAAGVIAAIITNAIAGNLVVQILTFGIRQIGLVLGVSVIVAAISSFLPVYKTARKKPIEAIRTA